jgi:hypothetical protein
MVISLTMWDYLVIQIIIDTGIVVSPIRQFANLWHAILTRWVLVRIHTGHNGVVGASTWTSKLYSWKKVWH